jgi:prophage regulatory protein
MATTILRLPEVKRITGLSRSSIYLRISQGRFPRSISLGGRAVGWVSSDVSNWVDERILLSRAECRLER